MNKHHDTSMIDNVLERTTKFVAMLVGVSVVWQTFRSISSFLAHWCVWFIAFYIATIGFGKPTGKKSKRIRRLLVGTVLLSAIILVVVQFIDHRQEVRAVQAIATFEKTLATGLWIAYEPSAFDPYEKEYPSIKDIRRELKILANDGFDSIITFSSPESLASIPKIAKELGFKAVIMGITHILDKQELTSAISMSDYVDAYCVGHMFSDYPYSEAEVVNALDIVKQSTGLPVSTTLRPNGYLVFPIVSNTVDFFFPDIHANWYADGRASSAFEATKNFVVEVRKLQGRYPGKPILLKQISIPSNEVPGSSTEQQYHFYRQVVEYVESSMLFPERVYPSYFSAFDLPWKSPERGWPPGERYLGLYEATGDCKSAMIEGKQTRVVEALRWSRICNGRDREMQEKIEGHLTNKVRL